MAHDFHPSRRLRRSCGQPQGQLGNREHQIAWCSSKKHRPSVWRTSGSRRQSTASGRPGWTASYATTNRKTPRPWKRSSRNSRPLPIRAIKLCWLPIRYALSCGIWVVLVLMPSRLRQTLTLAPSSANTRRSTRTAGETCELQDPEEMMRAIAQFIGNALLVAAAVPLFFLCLAFALVVEVLPSPMSRSR